MMPIRSCLILLSLLMLFSCREPTKEKFDILIKNAIIYDGSGQIPTIGSIGINQDTIAAIGLIKNATGTKEIDAQNLAVAPGFINMLSWATVSLIQDGRGLSDIKQGVTLEVMGEGSSMGPLSAEMKEKLEENQSDFKYEVSWRTLGEYLQYLEDRGVAPNVASFVGATTLRVHEMGYEDRPPTIPELENMKALARQAMEEGALGIGTS